MPVYSLGCSKFMACPHFFARVFYLVYIVMVGQVSPELTSTNLSVDRLGWRLSSVAGIACDATSKIIHLVNVTMFASTRYYATYRTPFYFYKCNNLDKSQGICQISAWQEPSGKHTFSWSFGDIKSHYLCICGCLETKATQPGGPLPTELVQSDIEDSVFEILWTRCSSMDDGDALMHVGIMKCTIMCQYHQHPLVDKNFLDDYLELKITWIQGRKYPWIMEFTQFTIFS